MSQTQTIIRKLQGTVVSDKMDKTVTVRVDRTKVHPKYGKRFIRSRKFLAHDAKNEYHVGDVVIIEAMRPMSARKRWKVNSRVSTARLAS